LRHGAEDLDRDLTVLVEHVPELAVSEDETAHRSRRFHRRGARPVVDERDLAKEIAGAESAFALTGVDLGLALVGDPDLVFLDEPTTGFDPAARRIAWDMIRSLRSLGKTVLLTTHYLDEAQELCDRVAVLREGLIVRIGTPAELRGTSLETEIRYRKDGQDVVVRTLEPTRVLSELTAEALAAGRELEGLEVRRPTLEDVYLELVAGE
jgi:ABC-type sugar transport system ATPase subunit